jgi:hypothetical protein
MSVNQQIHKLKNSIVWAFLFMALLGCKQAHKEIFTKEGVSFTIPEGWVITQSESIHDTLGYFLTCEKKGMNESGMFTLSWINQEVNKEEFLLILKEQLSQNSFYKNTGILFNEIQPIKNMDHFQVSSTGFVTHLSGLKHSGKIICFNCKGRTLGLIFQTAQEDEEKNKQGFEEIQKSFACNLP